MHGVHGMESFAILPVLSPGSGAPPCRRRSQQPLRQTPLLTPLREKVPSGEKFKRLQRVSGPRKPIGEMVVYSFYPMRGLGEVLARWVCSALESHAELTRQPQSFDFPIFFNSILAREQGSSRTP